MNGIDIAFKKIKDLTEDELHRYAQLCEIEMVEHRRQTKDWTPDKKLRYATPQLKHLKDQKETFLYELKLRQDARQQSKN